MYTVVSRRKTQKERYESREENENRLLQDFKFFSKTRERAPQLRRVPSTVSRRGSQQRHTLDPELSSLRERDTNHLFVECELKSFSLPRGYPPEVIVTQDDQGFLCHSSIRLTPQRDLFCFSSRPRSI
uniref:Uncharacterized protein n=1 Tax=Vespula pensylvanica TaxID=30213 RepID=A0A834U7X8_VESPE|nr:hypothetical protein H0235_010921 [Vespula pensylvanica]